MSLATPDLSSPYVGPRSFSAGDTLFGRDREAQELCDLLVSERIVLLHSPSGAGKTSLVQARLIPMLAEREFTVLPTMRVSQEPPGELAAGANRYLLSLLLSLQRALPAEGQRAADELAGRTLADLLAALPGQRDGQVLIFDQFEEILTVDPTGLAAKHAFFAQVGAALRDRSRWALFVMREDYIAALEPFLRPLPTRLSNNYRLDLLEPQAAGQAITGPARARGVAFAPGTVEGLVRDLRLVRVQHADGAVASVPGQYVEPVQLQVVCLRLWRTWARRLQEGQSDSAETIGPDDVAAMGDVGEALEAYYDECLTEVQAATGTPERALRDWFDGQLITSRGLRNQVLKGQEQTQGLPNATIAALIDSYLVRAEQRRGLTWYELAHDRLIEPVLASNGAWRDRTLQQFQRQAALWEAQRRPEGLLMRGKALEAAEEWSGAVEPVEREYLEASRALRASERQARIVRRTIWSLAALAFCFAIFAVLQAVQANQERQRAELARDEARARQLAAQSDQLRPSQPQQSLLLAVEAVSIPDREPLPEAMSALYSALAATGGTPLRGHNGTVWELAFSPDGALLATGGDDGTVRLWRTEAPGDAPVLLEGHTEGLRAIAFSPDGRLLATASNDGTARIWAVTQPETALAVLSGHAAAVTAFAFSRDGALLATGAGDGAILLWRTDDFAAAPTPLAGHSEAVTGLAFTPVGALASISDDATARIWASAGQGWTARTLSGHEDELKALALSPDGALLATGARDETVRIWRLDAEDAPTVLAGEIGSILGLAFSPNGSTLAAGGSAPTALVWSMADLAAAPEELRGHGSGVTAVAYTPDGATLITVSADKRLRAWATGKLNLPPLILAGHEQGLVAAATTSDGRHLATGSLDSTARLWPSGDLSPIAALRGPAKALLAVSFADDGRAVVAGDDTSAGTRWELGRAEAPAPAHAPVDAVSQIHYSAGARHVLTVDFEEIVRFQPLDPAGAPPVTLYQGANRTDPGRVVTAALSRDGGRAAAAIEDGAGSVRVAWWDLGVPDEPRSLPLTTDLVTALAFSPDGAALATGDLDGLVRIWDLASGATPEPMQGHSADLNALAFSPAGNLLASADGAGAIIVWETATGAERARLRAAEGNLLTITFSPDNRHIAAGGTDTLARLWDLSTPGVPPVTLAGHADSVFALAFSPDGATLATAGADGIVRLWPLAVEELRAAGCATAGRNLSEVEWRASFGEELYRKTCADLPGATG